jgi:transcriptional regulator with XRE-family HTH domain
MAGTGEADRKRTFGIALRAARQSVGLSQQQLAGELSVSQPSVAAWEAGVNEPVPATVFRAEEVLGLEPGALAEHLGYLPARRRFGRTTTVDAIAGDPTLGAREREALLALYRALSAPSPRKGRTSAKRRSA